MNEYLLCYVNKNEAFFTKEDLSEAWWNNWIENPRADVSEFKEKYQKGLIKVVSFNLKDNTVTYGNPQKATFTSQWDEPWFSYWTTGNVEGFQTVVNRDILSGISLTKFIKLISNDGGVVSELELDLGENIKKE